MSLENSYINEMLHMNCLWKRFSMKARRKNNFYQNVASVGKKRQKSTNGNTTLDKESIFKLIKAVFKEEFERQ